jgi:hypothetical protein
LNRVLDLDQVGIDFRSKSWFMASTWIIAGQKICLVLIGCISRIGLGLVFFTVRLGMVRSGGICSDLIPYAYLYVVLLYSTMCKGYLQLNQFYIS